MTRFTESYAIWLADYYLLATALLALALAAAALLKQPAQRLMVTKSTLIALVLLAVLCALPGWSLVHLLAADRSPISAASVPVEHLDIGQRPDITQSNNVRRAEQPALAPPTTDDVLPKTNKPKMSWPALLAITHVVGMACIVAWLSLGWLASVRLRRTAQTAPANVHSVLDELASRNCSASNRLRLFTHDHLDVAVALGVWQPMILLPSRWTSSQSNDHLRAVLAHESTHILNHDLQWVAVTRTLFIALWANPLFWLMKRRLRLDQEALADAAAADVTSRQQYAEQLVAWARDARRRPALHLSSAVGLWEGPSQLRQRIALLLNEQLIVWRECSRKWRLTAAGLSMFAAFMLSLVTLQPAESQEKAPAEAATPDAEAPAPTDPVKLDDRFILCPVTTELQRSLLGDVDQPLSKASLCVFVNFAELKDEPIEAGSPFFAGLAAKLSAFAKTDNELATFRVFLGSLGQIPFDTVQKRADSLAKLCETIGKESGFKTVRSSRTYFGSDFDWTKYVAAVESDVERIKSSEVTLGEKSIGNDRVRAFAVSTFLSRMLAQDTDCVVNIKPIVRLHDGARFPSDFTNSMQEFIPKLKYGRNKTMLVRVRFAESEKETLNEWVNNNDGRRAFARQFGFEYCNLQQSQVAAEDVAKLEHDGTAAQKPVDKKTSANTSPAVAKQAQQGRSTPNTIVGRAIDEKGQPIAGAEALLFRINRIDSSRKLQAKTLTDAEGKYRFENVIDIPKEFPDGKLLPLNPLDEEFVQVYVRTPGRVAGMRVELRQQIARAGDIFDMTLSPAVTLTGRVTGPDGKPVRGALVQVGNSGFAAWEEVAAARTKPDGTYVINDVGPYSMEEYRKKEAEQRRSMEAFASNKDHYSVHVAPPVLTVEHPDFAIARTTYDKIPGTQNVKLEPAAIIDGRVVFGNSAKPAAGAIVHLATSRSNNTLPTAEQSISIHYFDFRADAEGKYRFAMLPAGNYDLSAEMPGWVNVGIDAFEAASGKTSTAPNLVLTKGGVISIRLVDDKTGKPIELTPDTRADISAHQFPFPKGINRPNWTPNAAANPAGRFDLHALPGKRAVMVSRVYVGEKTIWAGKTSPGELKLPTVDVVEGKTVEVDIPVVKMDEPKAAAIYKNVQPAPVEKPKPRPKRKSPSDRAANNNDGANTSRPNGAENSAPGKPPATPVKFQLVQNTAPVAEKTVAKRATGILGYGDDKPDGKKSLGGSGEMIQFELPVGVTKIKGIRIHGSRYGQPQAPKEDFEITFLNEKRDETLHVEAAPYRLFNRGKEQWVRVAFKNEVELPRKFWVCLNFNAAQTKGVYVSYDTSTKGEYSRVGLAGDKEEPKETDFKGDWMVQLLLAKPEK